MFSLEKLWSNLIEPFLYLEGAYRKLKRDFLQGNSFKLTEGRFRLDIGREFFTVSVVRLWHNLPREAVDDPHSLEVFKAMLDEAWSDLAPGRCPCPWDMPMAKDSNEL